MFRKWNAIKSDLSSSLSSPSSRANPFESRKEFDYFNIIVKCMEFKSNLFKSVKYIETNFEYKSSIEHHRLNCELNGIKVFNSDLGTHVHWKMLNWCNKWMIAWTINWSLISMFFFVSFWRSFIHSFIPFHSKLAMPIVHHIVHTVHTYTHTHKHIIANGKSLLRQGTSIEGILKIIWCRTRCWYSTMCSLNIIHGKRTKARKSK